MRKTMLRFAQVPLTVLALLGFIGSMALAFQPHAVLAGTQCGDVKTSFDFSCPGDTKSDSKNLENNTIYFVLLFLVNAMSIGVGAVIIGSIFWQAIQYAGSNGSPDKAKNARSGIINAVIALLLFLSMYAILNFIIPGGIFQ